MLIDSRQFEVDPTIFSCERATTVFKHWSLSLLAWKSYFKEMMALPRHVTRVLPLSFVMDIFRFHSLVFISWKVHFVDQDGFLAFVRLLLGCGESGHQHLDLSCILSTFYLTICINIKHIVVNKYESHLLKCNDVQIVKNVHMTL